MVPTGVWGHTPAVGDSFTVPPQSGCSSMKVTNLPFSEKFVVDIKKMYSIVICDFTLSIQKFLHG